MIIKAVKEEILGQFGLNTREIQLYLALLREQTSTPNKLAQITGINRTTVYLDLDSLKQQGLVTSYIKHAKKHYQATDPKKLLEILEEKKQNVRSILPQLENLYAPRTDLYVELFEGKQGIKKIYEDIVEKKDSVLVLGATGKSYDVLLYYYPHLIQKAIQANIQERCIANYTAQEAMKKHPENFVSVKFLPQGNEAHVTTIIYADKVAHLCLQEDKIYAVLIREQYLNNTYRAHFELLWSLLPA